MSAPIKVTVHDNDRAEQPERPWAAEARDESGDLIGAAFGATIPEALTNLADEVVWDEPVSETGAPTKSNREIARTIALDTYLSAREVPIDEVFDTEQTGIKPDGVTVREQFENELWSDVLHWFSTLAEDIERALNGGELE